MRTSKLKKSLLLMLLASVTGGAFAQTWTDITDGSGLSFTTKTGFGNPGKAGGSAAKDQVFEL